MSKFEVHMIHGEIYSLTVDANSLDEAKEIALANAANGEALECVDQTSRHVYQVFDDQDQQVFETDEFDAIHD